MINDLEIIKTTLKNFIDSELVVNNNSNVTISDFMSKLEVYFKLNKVFFDKYKIRLYTSKFLGDKINIIKYNSTVFKGQRVYSNFNWKDNGNKSLTTVNLDLVYKEITLLKQNITSINLNLLDKDNEIALLNENITAINSNLLDKNNEISLLNENITTINSNLLDKNNEISLLKESINVLILKVETTVNKEEKVKKNNITISESLNINLNKDISYSLDQFLNDYVDFSEESTEILYVNTMVDDYIKCTNSSIIKNKLCKMVAQYFKDRYNNKLEIKFYQDLKYYKGLYYKK